MLINTYLFQEKFIVEMEKIITKTRTVKLVKDAGWYSESEMRSDLGWHAFLGCMY